MKYKTWKPIYEAILEDFRDFGFDRRKDEAAARVASEILERKKIEVGGERVKRRVEELVRGKTAVVCGNAPCLESDLREAGFSSSSSSRDSVSVVVIAADGATSVLLRNALLPDIVVTDLDGEVADEIHANRLGAVLVVHAHGDNIAALRSVLPALNEEVLCTTQSRPFRNIYNFGGFTDGDRCVFLAKEFGARRVELLGFDFEDEGVSERKRKKLKWAKRLISISTAP